MKAVVAAFNQEKALVGAFSVITNLRMELFEALLPGHRDRARVDEVHHEAQLGKGHPLRVPQDDHLAAGVFLIIQKILNDYYKNIYRVICWSRARQQLREVGAGRAEDNLGIYL